MILYREEAVRRGLLRKNGSVAGATVLGSTWTHQLLALLRLFPLEAKDEDSTKVKRCTTEIIAWEVVIPVRADGIVGASAA